MAAAFRRHRLERAQRADHVVPVVPGGVLHGVRDHEPRREVHHRGGARLPQRAAYGGDIGDVAFDQPAAEHGAAMTRREVVVDDHVVAGLAQRLRGVAADVAGAAGHQDHVASQCRPME